MGSLLRLSAWIDVLNFRIGQAMYWLSLVMILIGAYNAIVRYISRYIGRNLSSNMYLELQWYLFGAIFMLGTAYALRFYVRVRVDIFYSKLSPKRQALG